MFDVTVSFWPVVVSAVAAWIVGALWYSPLLFGNVWGKDMGFDRLSKTEREKMMKGMWVGYIGTFLANLLVAYVLAMFIQLTLGAGKHLFLDGVKVAFWIWLGFMVTTGIGGVFWGMKTKRVFMIDALYQLVYVGLMGGVLAVWI